MIKLSDVDWGSVAWNLVDAILMGIPSAVVVPEVQKQYNIEISDLNKLYNLLNKEYNQLSDQGLSNDSIKGKLKEAMYGTNPLGAWRATLEDKYKQLEKKGEEIDDKKKQLNNQIHQVSDALAAKTSAAADANYIGKITNDWLKDQSMYDKSK